MPRNYSPYTPSGDPTNPLSLLTPSISIPQVNFTPQTAVAPPENQWETLQKILFTGAGAAKSVIDYKTETIKNEIAVNAAIEAAQQKQEVATEKSHQTLDRAQNAIDRANRDQQIKEKESQNSIIESYDARITSALLADQYDNASRIGDEFSALYPVSKNPYMAAKAQDQLLRIKSARTGYENNKDREVKTLSAAAQGSVISDSIGVLERLQGQFNNPETRGNVYDLFPTVGPNAVPDDQLHVKVVDYVMRSIPQEKLPLLTDTDRVEISTAILRQSEAFRNQILRDRNQARTYQRIQTRTEAAVAETIKLSKVEDLPKIFAEFDNIQSDKESGFINQTQQSNLENNLAVAIGMNAGRGNPVSGAIAYSKLIQSGIDSGDIPLARGKRVEEILKRRANDELQAKIQEFKANAIRIPNVNEDTAIYEMSPQMNPAIELGDRLGVYSTNPDGTKSVTPGMENLGQQLDALSNEWSNQQSLFQRNGKVKGRIDTIDNLNSTIYDMKRIDTATKNDENTDRRDENTIRIAGNLFQSTIAFSNDPNKRESYLVPLYRVVSDELARIGVPTDQANKIKYSPTAGQLVVSTEVKNDTDFQKFVGLASSKDMEGLAQSLMKYYGEKVNGVSGENGRYSRTVWLNGMKMLLDNTVTESQKSSSINAAKAIDFTPEQLTQVARSASDGLLKSSKNMNVQQRMIEEDRVGRLVGSATSIPTSWMKYIGDNYFASGSTPDTRRRGYEMFRNSKGIMVDNNGNAVNFASTSSVEAEIAMRNTNPTMYDTMVIAEGLSIGTNKKPEDFLDEAYSIALSYDEQQKSTKGFSKTQGDLIPQVYVDPMSGKPMFSGSLYETRLNQLRDAFKQEFKRTVGRGDIETTGDVADPSLNVDAEDYQRMNAIFQGFKSRGYDSGTAVRATIRSMKQMGYDLSIGNNGEGNTIHMVFDPWRIMPNDSQKSSPEMRDYISELMTANDPNRASIDLRKHPEITVTWMINSDLTDPQGKVRFTVTFPDMQRMELSTSRQEFEMWNHEQETQRDLNRVQ